MVPLPEEFTYEFWLTGPTEYTSLTCLMPNGVMIILETSHNATLAEIKEELWDEATKYPLYGTLHDMSVYIFMCINSMAELEELIDENRRLCDIRPTGAVLKITECVGDKADNSLNVQIGHLIGKRLQEFDALSSPEINDFRFKMRKLGDEVAQDRSKRSWEKRLYYQFAPRLSFVSESRADAICRGANLQIISKFESVDNAFTFNIPHSTTPVKLLETILAKRSYILNTRGESPHDYVLKVCGRDEYLVGDYGIIQFQYVQDSLFRDITPIVVTTSVHSVPMLIENDYEKINHLDNKKPRSSFSTLTLRKKGKHKSSWNIEENFAITLCTISGLNCDTKRNVEIGVQVGLFHGGKSLCQPQKTSEKLVTEKCECLLNETLKFDIKVCNIPRNAKLCVVVYEVTKNSKGNKTKRIRESSNKDVYPIVWGNTTVFDFRSHFKSGAMTLYMWTYAEDMINDDVFHPLGTVVSNPNTKYATALTLIYDSFGQEQQTILYPSVESKTILCTKCTIRIGKRFGA
uniref:PI3K-RBD domain-containing protein n=1 Tax=Photinus pyralis TaxID=7054 RepID=A0A1Y1N7Q3_PHOPY